MSDARQFEYVKVEMSFERSGGGELHWMGRLSKSRCYMFANPLQQVLAQFSELDSVYIDQSAGPSNTCVEVLTLFAVCQMSVELRDGHIFQKKKLMLMYFICQTWSAAVMPKFTFSNPVHAYKCHINAFYIAFKLQGIDLNKSVMQNI